MTTQLHTNVECPSCRNPTTAHKIDCVYFARRMDEVKPFLAPVLDPQVGRAFPAHVERYYADASKQFRHLISDPNHRPLWLHFRSDSAHPGDTARYRRDFRDLTAVAIDFPIPSELTEPDIRDLVKKFLEDGFVFKGVTRG